MPAATRTPQSFVLENGLRVVVDPDRASHLVGVAVVYDVGFRSEPEGRTGFAHLFEHMMFQGSARVGKVEHSRLVEGAGGVWNGHTLADLTCYYEALPANALELALFLEADRMGFLAITEENLENQISVVKEEIRRNVLNQPYGGFPWIVLPELAFDTFQNSHNGYGDFAHLERATVSDATDFHRKFYAPSNAVLAVSGRADPEAVARLAEKYFLPIAGGRAPRHGPWHEPALRRTRRKRITDALAPQPAFVIGYRTPDPVQVLDQHVAYLVLARLLTDGDASRLRARLVHAERSVTDVTCSLGVFGSDNFFMRDPVLFQTTVAHPGEKTTEALVSVVDEELARLAAGGPSRQELERVAAAYASSYWRGLDSELERAIGLASLEVVHGRAALVSELPQLVASVTADEVSAAAGDLVAQHPAIVEIRPSSDDGGGR